MLLQVILLIVCLMATSVSGQRAARAFRDRKIQRSARWAGWALLPIGAYMAGLVTLVSRVGTAVGRWVVNLVFNPITWAGLVVMALGVALLLLSGFRLRHNAPAEDPTRA